MWSISKVKEVGLAAFKKNYWKSVLVSFILMLVGGGIGGFSFNNSFSDYSSDSSAANPFNFSSPADVFSSTVALVTVLSIVSFAVLIGFAIGIAIDVFLVNPIEVGGARFFNRNLTESSEIKEIGYAFDRSYKNVVKVMFFKDLYVFLWSLLLIIPGIVKAYEYMMVPYLLTENPDMDRDFALAESSRLMNGNKWNAFVLDLSFIGWHILSIFTCGLLEIFYVAPYVHSSHAALYDAVKITNPYVAPTDSFGENA